MKKVLYYVNGIEENPIPVVIVKEWDFKGFRVIRYCVVEGGIIGEERDCVENGFTRFVEIE